jgi:hypothetical protein
LTPNFKDKHNEEDVQRHGNVVYFENQDIQLEYATDYEHVQDNSVSCVPMVLTQLANSYFKK